MDFTRIYTYYVLISNRKVRESYVTVVISYYFGYETCMMKNSAEENKTYS